MTMDTFRLIGLLLKNALRFQYLKHTGKPGRPQALSLEITHDCVARCTMCNIWKIPADVPNLPLPQWIELLSSELFADVRELDITGGEPFMRDDLRDLFSGICGLKSKNLAALRSMAVTTNGLLTDRVLSTVESGLPLLHRKELDLVVVCALDAVGELHDRIRNYPGAWSKVCKTLERLARLRDRHSNLIVGLKTTVVPLNIGELEKISEFADARGLFTIISPCIITPGRYLNPDRAADLAFSPEDVDQMIDFFSKDRFRWSYHADALVDFYKTGAINKPCACGFNYLFIRSSGAVFLCPLVGWSVGNITQEDISDLYHGKTADSLRKKIGKMPQCRDCTEPGLERYALPFEGFHYLKLLLKLGKTGFCRLHNHMGLDKYI
jgi:MoaA/NifB/PqqE/SkfB family radical SAM enzyme